MVSALVFGGSGQLGGAVAERLLASGWKVSVVTRGGRRPRQAVIGGAAMLLDGTRKSRAAMIGALDRPVDAVFDPTAYDEADAADLLEARARFGSLVTVSSASVYANPAGQSLVSASRSGRSNASGPISEEAPIVDAGPASYATRKAALERRLLAAEIPVSILRSCAVYGRQSTHPREWWFIKRALDGRKAIPVAYDAESVFHTSSARGLADLTRICMDNPGARILNVADSNAPSIKEIAAAITDATSLKLPLAPFAGAPIGPAHVGSTPWSSENPLVLDTSRGRRLGWEGSDYHHDVQDVCNWVLDVSRHGDWRAQFSRFSHYGYDPFDYGAEDRALASL